MDCLVKIELSPGIKFDPRNKSLLKIKVGHHYLKCVLSARGLGDVKSSVSVGAALAVTNEKPRAAAINPVRSFSSFNVI